jgi:hypothetical protein
MAKKPAVISDKVGVMDRDKALEVWQWYATRLKGESRQSRLEREDARRRWIRRRKRSKCGGVTLQIPRRVSVSHSQSSRYLVARYSTPARMRLPLLAMSMRPPRVGG